MFTAGSLGVGTLAWFTRGTEAAASGFDFTAAAASGIQVSTDAETWRSNIAGGDFDTTTPGGVQEGNRVTVNSMEPVSTVDSVSAGEMDFYGAVSADGGFTLASDTSNYLVFDLYFLNQGAEDLTLSLTSNSTVTDDPLADENTSLSTRVAFVIEGSNNEASVVTQMSNGTSAYIWEPNSLVRSDTAVASGATNMAKYNYNGVNSDNGSTEILPAGVDSYGFLAANASYTAPVTTTKDIAIGDSPVIGTLPGAAGGQITKIKVYVWIEGQDLDCNNSTSAGRVLINLGFDSGAASTALEAKTATDISTSTGVSSTVNLSGNENGGATYTAYVFQAGNDATVSLDYRLFFSQGTATDLGSGVTSIALDDEVVAGGTYDVVVAAVFTGAISTITTASVTNTVA